MDIYKRLPIKYGCYIHTEIRAGIYLLVFFFVLGIISAILSFSKVSSAYSGEEIYLHVGSRTYGVFIILYGLIVFFATSRIGFYLIPIILFLRGYSLCSMFALFSFYGQVNTNDFFVCIYVGLCTTIGMFLLSEESFSCSYAIHRMCSGLSRSRLPIISFNRVIVSVILFALAAFSRQLMIS